MKLALSFSSFHFRIWNVKQCEYNMMLEQTLLDLDEILREGKFADPKNKELLTIYGKRRLLLSLNWTKPRKELKVRMSLPSVRSILSMQGACSLYCQDMAWPK